MGLILGLFIGLITGLVLGAAVSFPVGSAMGIFIDRSFNGWAVAIEIVIILLCAFIILKFFNVRLKRS